MKKVNKIPKTTKVKLSGFYRDKRGIILNLRNGLFGSCALIKSKKNSVRANHYHKKDWHYCYVLKGKIAYYYRKHGSKTKPKKIIINQGELFFTPPMEDHATVFLEDCEILCIKIPSIVGDKVEVE